MMAVLATLWGCSHDDDNDEPANTDTKKATVVANGKPQWKMDWSSNEQAPQWTSPNAKDYEKWMIFMVRLEDELAEMASEDDLMAVFINGEIRSFNKPAKDTEGNINSDGVKFILKILGNEKSEQKISLSFKYYSQKLKQTFSVDKENIFVNEKVWGVDEELVLPFTYGSSKYPVVMQLGLRMNLGNLGIKSQPNDIVAVMVGDECRGMQTIEEGGSTSSNLSLSVFGHQENEGARILYYSGLENVVYDLGVTIQIKNGTQIISVQ